MEQLDASLIVNFLSHLETGRGHGPGTGRERSWRTQDPFRFRIHSTQARPNSRKALSFAVNASRFAACAATYLRTHGSAGHQRSPKGLSLAWTRAHAHDCNLHT